ncbi:MAG: D-glycero-beta-D-manno-heptose-7-phosphate kinase [Verrucomicrobia bacterium]|nr:D-glycero-beta-D-manno-heptose-7-phosphate kinase [Verrucomicrobiota bacterium]
MDVARARALLSSLPSCRILVIGDLMLDEFIYGKVGRISPEAPVPVVEVTRQQSYPGGAANVARNLREFTDRVALMGVVGACEHAAKLRSLLAGQGIELGGMVTDPEYQTIVKTRIIARQQHVVRVDRERRGAPAAASHEAALRWLEAHIGEFDAVILEDYAKGFLTQDFVDRASALAQAAGKVLTVDPNPNNPLRWPGATAIKPNRSEAFAAAGRAASEPVTPVEEDAALAEVGAALMAKWNCPLLLVTLGEQGMMLFRREQPPFALPTRAREVFDVSGAGDTVIALFTLCLAAGATPAEAAEMANHAAGVVVGKLGTATLTPDELLASFEEE